MLIRVRKKKACNPILLKKNPLQSYCFLHQMYTEIQQMTFSSTLLGPQSGGCHFSASGD